MTRKIGVMNRLKVIFNRFLILLVLIGAMIVAMSGVALAASSDSQVSDNITLEYHYTEGEEGIVDIPDSIEEFYREYRLVSVTGPILENTLPRTRTYTFRVDGAMTEDELASFSDTENLVLTPVDTVLERNVDKIELITNLPNNDVEDLPQSRMFELSSASSPGGVAQTELMRAGISFEVTERDEYGLPSSYNATIVYRGTESYMGAGYYLAEIKYTQTEELEGIPQYVVVAVYEPVEGLAPVYYEPLDIENRTPDIVSDAGGQPWTEPPVWPVIEAEEVPEVMDTVVQSLPENVDENSASLNPHQLAQLPAEVLEELRGSGVPIIMIGDREVPLFGGGNPYVWSLVNLVLSSIGVLFAIIIGVRFAAQKRREHLEFGLIYVAQGDETREKRRITWLVTAVLMGVAGPVVFFLTQDMSLLMVLLDRWSIVNAVILAVEIVSYLLAFRQEGDDGGYAINAEDTVSVRG